MFFVLIFYISWKKNITSDTSSPVCSSLDHADVCEWHNAYIAAKNGDIHRKLKLLNWLKIAALPKMLTLTLFVTLTLTLSTTSANFWQLTSEIFTKKDVIEVNKWARQVRQACCRFGSEKNPIDWRKRDLIHERAAYCLEVIYEWTAAGSDRLDQSD